MHRPKLWLEFLKHLYAEVQRDRVANAAAALAFYTMLAVFPAAIFGLSLLPYLPIPQLSQAIFDLLRELLPGAAADLFTGTVERIVSDRSSGLLSFGFAFAVWSASSGLYALMQQLNVVYGVEESRSFWKARAVALLLTLLFFLLLIVTFGLVIFGGMVQDWVADTLGWSTGLRLFFAVFRWCVIVLALITGFALVYRLAPNARRPFRLLRAGEIVATLGFIAASLGFKLYVANFGSFDSTYGSLGAVIVFLTWLFIVGWVILLGGEINDLIGRKKRQSEPASVETHSSERPAQLPPPPSREGTRAAQGISIVVWGGLAANVAIAIAKYIAAGVTGSSALLSEAIHSTADSGNGLLLVVGALLSRKPADDMHPFGRGQEIYFWGLIVALVLFGLGGGLSFYEGVQHVLNPHEMQDATWNYVVLGCALVFEGTSFGIAVHNMQRIARREGVSFFKAAHDSKNPEHFVVLFEDAAAILGILTAFAGVFASHALQLPVLDGVASIVIGVILTTAALFLAYECRSLLLGESADPKQVASIRAIAATDKAVERVGRALTMYLGTDEVLLNLEVHFKDHLEANQVEAAVSRLERSIRARHPHVRKIFIEAASVGRTRATPLVEDPREERADPAVAPEA